MDYSFIHQWIAAGNIEIPALLLMHQQKLGLSDQELIFILHVKYALDRGEAFPDFKRISKFMGKDIEEVYQLVQNLIENKNIAIQTVKTEEGRASDKISLELLWEKLFILLSENKKTIQNNQQITLQKDLYAMFESEFGRPLSPIELETLSMWMHEDKYSSELIALALKEAVLAQAYSFKYIDRVLLNWSKKNIKTKEQVQKESERFRHFKTESSVDKDSDAYCDPVPMFNWLKPGEDAEDE